MIRPIFHLLFFAGALLLFNQANAQPTNFSKGSPAQKSRIVSIQDARATDLYLAKPEIIPAMVERGILQLTGKTNLTEAWRSIVSTNDVIGIKVFSNSGPQNGTRPAVAAAVIESLLEAGFAPEKIILWDRHFGDLFHAGFVEFEKKYKVKVLSAAQVGWDEKAFYETAILGRLAWGDLEFGKTGDDIGRKSFVSKLLTQQVTKIISIAPLLNHNSVGVHGHLYNLALGSTDNTMRFENSPERLVTAVPEIFALPQIVDHFVLGITDALICQHEGQQRTLLQYSRALNELWFSKDPVALDVHALQVLDEQRRRAKIPLPEKNVELYENAALLQLGVSDPNRIVIEEAK